MTQVKALNVDIQVNLIEFPKRPQAAIKPSTPDSATSVIILGYSVVHRRDNQMAVGIRVKTEEGVEARGNSCS